MIASSATVMSNLAYLIGAIVVAVIGGVIVWLRHRQPQSVDATMESFRRGLDVLAPDTSSTSPALAWRAPPGIRPESGGLEEMRAGRRSGESGLPGGFPPLPEETADDRGPGPAGRQAGDQPG